MGEDDGKEPEEKQTTPKGKEMAKTEKEDAKQEAKPDQKEGTQEDAKDDKGSAKMETKEHVAVEKTQDGEAKEDGKEIKDSAVDDEGKEDGKDNKDSEEILEVKEDETKEDGEENEPNAEKQQNENPDVAVAVGGSDQEDPPQNPARNDPETAASEGGTTIQQRKTAFIRVAKANLLADGKSKMEAWTEASEMWMKSRVRRAMVSAMSESERKKRRFEL